MGKEGRYDSLTCWNISSLHRRLRQLYQGAMLASSEWLIHHIYIWLIRKLKYLVEQAMRLFVGEPVWTPYNRPHDHLPARYNVLFSPFVSSKTYSAKVHPRKDTRKAVYGYRNGYFTGKSTSIIS